MKRLKVIFTTTFFTGVFFKIMEWVGGSALLEFSLFLLCLSYLVDSIIAGLKKNIDDKYFFIIWNLTVFLWLLLFIFKTMYWWQWFYIQYIAYVFTLLTLLLFIPSTKSSKRLDLLIKENKISLLLTIFSLIWCVIPYSTLIYVSEIYFDSVSKDDKAYYNQIKCEQYGRYTEQLQSEKKLEILQMANADASKYCKIDTSGIRKSIMLSNDTDYDIKDAECLKLYKQSLAFVDQGNYSNAQKGLLKCNEIEPNNPTVLTSLGVTFLSLGNPEKALECYYNSIKADSLNIAAYVSAGYALMNEKRFKESIKILQLGYSKSNLKQIEHYGICANLSLAYLNMDSCSQAKKYFLLAKENDLNNSQFNESLKIIENNLKDNCH